MSARQADGDDRQESEGEPTRAAGSFAETLVDWSPALAGLALIGLSAANVVMREGTVVHNGLEVALPFLVGVVVLVIAPSFRRLELDARSKLQVVGTALFVGVLAASVLLWEHALLALDGITLPLDERVQAVFNGLSVGLVVGGFAGYYRTHSVRQLEGIADARRDFQEIFEKADVGIALNDPETGTIARVNPSYADMQGYEPEELEGVSIGELSGDDPDFDQERARDLMGRAMAGEPQQFDWLIERKDGSTFWAEVSLKHVTIGGDSRLLASVRDVSERKRREQQLSKFQEIYAKADHAIGLTDPETGTIVETNPKYAEILGYEPEELEGMRIDDISADSPDFSQEEAFEIIQRAMAGEPQSLDWQLVRKDGSTVWVAVSLKRATIGDEERLLAFFQDVSQRKEGEKALDRHRAEMEFFNSLLRHDVLNGITVIRTHGKRLADTLEGDEREHAETIVEWADNTAGVVDRVRDVLETLTGEADPDLHPVDLSATVRSELDRLRSTYADVAFETDVEADFSVRANDLLDDVIGNVLTNSIDHNDAEDLTIATSASREGDTVTLRIADDGAGIEDGDKEAVFRRGETGHVKKTGSGFGLYFVDAMMEAYGGDVYIEDNDPSGATFVLEFQAA